MAVITWPISRASGNATAGARRYCGETLRAIALFRGLHAWLHFRTALPSHRNIRPGQVFRIEGQAVGRRFASLMIGVKGASMAMRECPYCGRRVFDKLTQCSFCRERLPEVRSPRPIAATAGGGDSIRRGLLFMLGAAVIGYFAGTSSPWISPVAIPPAVANYLSPLLFLSGLGLSFHGFYLRHWAHR